MSDEQRISSRFFRSDPSQLELDFERKPTALLSVAEIFDQLDERLISELKEDFRFERKPAGIHADALGPYLSAYANTKPDGGIVAVGVEDDGRISGCLSATTAHLNNLEKAGTNFCPDAKYECKRLEIINSGGARDFILIFRIFYKSNRVVETVRGEAFIRRGDSKYRLNDEQKRELQLDKGQVEIETEPVAGLKYPDDFNLSAIHEFAESFRKMRGIRIKSDAEVLVLRHLGKFGLKGVFEPNVACALLFAKDTLSVVPGCRIRFLRFDGETEGTGAKFNAVKDIWIEGTIPEIIVEVESVLQSQLREFSQLGPDGKFYTINEYPKAAWYEAIVNACVHRSYNLKNSPIFVKMFDDRLVIESPGGFPGVVTPENIYDMHNPRNPHLMEAMYYLEFVKCAHEGTRRMRDTMAELKLPAPEFSQRDSSQATVQVVLKNNVKQRKVWIDSDATSVVAAVILKSLTEDQKRIINFVAEHKSINVSQAARLLGSRWQSTKKRLEELVGKDILVRESKMIRDAKAKYILKKLA